MSTQHTPTLADLYKIAGTENHPNCSAAINVLDAIDNGEVSKNDAAALVAMFKGGCV